MLRFSIDSDGCVCIGIDVLYVIVLSFLVDYDSTCMIAGVGVPVLLFV